MRSSRSGRSSGRSSLSFLLLKQQVTVLSLVYLEYLRHKLNSKVVTYAAYNATLLSPQYLGPKNLLVFQGDAVASQSPRELSRLVDQISGSLELSGEYERAREMQDGTTENATSNFTKRRCIVGEIKQYKEKKGESERFESLCQEKVRAIKKITSINNQTLPGRSHPQTHPLQAFSHRRINRTKQTRDQY